MSKRLQVLVPEAEMAEIRRRAQRDHLSVGEWVRRALRQVRARQPVHDPQAKLKAIRQAVGYSFPTPEMRAT